MANDVVLGAAMRSNLLSLQNTQRSIDSTQLRLATGKKVNSALDNPQSFFQAQSLNNRASDLTRLLDGIGQSIRTIEEADKGITALTTLVTQAQSVAEEAQAEINAAEGLVSITGSKNLSGIDDLVADSGGAITNGQTFTITFVDEDVASGVAQTATFSIDNGDTVYDLAAEINNVTTVGNSDFTDNVKASVDSQGRLKIESKEDGGILRVSGGTLTAAGYQFLGLDGTVKSENNVAAVRNGGTAIAGRKLVSAESGADTVNDKYQSSANLFSATAADNAGYLSSATAAVDIVITVDGVRTNAGNVVGSQTIQDVVDTINNNGPDEVTASFNEDTGRIELTFADNVGSAELEFLGTAAGSTTFGFGTGASDVGALTAGQAGSEQFRFIGSSANLDQYTKDFNKLRDQIDGIVEDANYRGVNLLGGDNLTSFFNEDRSNTLVTEGGDFTVEGLGISKADFLDAGSIEKSLNEVRNALDSVRAFGSSIANDLSIIQTRRDFTEQTINTLKAGASDLTDADLNEEGANLLALQTAQQLGVTSLSLASQSQQSVLRLF